MLPQARKTAVTTSSETQKSVGFLARGVLGSAGGLWRLRRMWRTL